MGALTIGNGTIVPFTSPPIRKLTCVGNWELGTDDAILLTRKMIESLEVRYLTLQQKNGLVF